MLGYENCICLNRLVRDLLLKPLELRSTFTAREASVMVGMVRVVEYVEIDGRHTVLAFEM